MGSDAVREIRIPQAGGLLLGDMILPAGAVDPPALVLFIDGRGCGRHGIPDRGVARAVRGHGIATLLIDLLTPEEQQEKPHPGLHGVDLPRLTQRVLDVTGWLARDPHLGRAALGLCGLGGGAPAALIAAGRLGATVRSLVCIGGRADQAGPTALASVRAPTLLMAGSRDAEALAHNDAAYQHLRCVRSEAVVPGAGPGLDEPDALALAAEMAGDWYEAHFLALEEMA